MSNQHIGNGLLRPRGWGAFSVLAYVFLALFVMSVLGAVAYSIARDRATLLEWQGQRARGNVQVFEDQISQTLQLIENLVKTLPDATDTPLHQSHPADLQSLLSRLQHSQPAIRSLSIVSRGEGIRASSNPANVGLRPDMAPFLPQDIEGSDNSSMRLGTAWVGRDLADGRPATAQQPGAWDQPSFIPLVQRLGTGEQAIWVLVALNPDYLLGRHARYSQSQTDHFEMVRLDGSVLLTTQENPLGVQFGPADLLARAQATEAGEDMGQLVPNRLTAYRNAPKYPFFVAVHIDPRPALRQWVDKSGLIGLGTVLALSMVVAAALWLMQRVQKNERAKRQHLRTIRMLSQAIEQNPGGVLITNPQGEIEYCNPFFAKISGYTPQDLMGKPAHLLDAGGTSLQAFEEILRVLNEGEHWSGEFVYRHRDGHEYTVFAVLAPLRDDNGEITQHINVNHDITAQKQMQRALELERDRAEAATVAKSQFLANMSHEIRTPMNGVIGLTELTLETELDDTQRDYLTAVKNSASALMGLLNNILDFSKIEAGRMDLEAVAFSLPALLDEVAVLFRTRAERKGVEFRVELGADAPGRLKGDVTRLRQVLVNLCDNALKFTAQGSVTLGVNTYTVGSTHIEARFSVCDTGIGIAADKKQSVFEAFNQGDTTTTRQYGGTGLGLTICSRLVELMGGRIWLESEEGKGSCFYFTARLAPDEVLAPRPEPAVIVTSTSGDTSKTLASDRSLRVLVVEDNKVNQMLATTLLQRWGHYCEVAENGQIALDKLAQAPWDLILMDLQMPVMGGLEATSRIRKAEQSGQHIPIVAVTANVGEEDQRACKAVGMDEFLSKPLQAGVLKATLARFCA